MLLILERGEGIESDQRSICRDNCSRRAYDDSPRDGGVARNGFGGGGGGGGGAAPEYWGGRRTDRDVDWPDVTRESAIIFCILLIWAEPMRYACVVVARSAREHAASYDVTLACR